MEKPGFVNREDASGRLPDWGQITDLSSGFKLKGGGTPFTIMICPKSATEDAVKVISAESYKSVGFRPTPIVLNSWNEYMISEIQPNGDAGDYAIDLTQYDVFWAAGGYAEPAEAPTPPTKSLLDVKKDDNLRGVTITCINTHKPMRVFDGETADSLTFQGIFKGKSPLDGIVGVSMDNPAQNMMGIFKNSDMEIPFYGDFDGSQEWTATTYTFPDDEDFIVTENTATATTDGTWSFADTIVSEVPGDLTAQQ